MDDYIQMSPEMVEAKQRGDVARLLELVEQGADLRAIDYREGWTLLHWAACHGHVDLARALLDRGADRECTDEEGQTPLMLAASAGHLDMVRLLLERGANPVAETRSEWDAAGFARMNNHTVVQLVLEMAARTPRATADRKRAQSQKEKRWQQDRERDIRVACELFIARPENVASQDPLVGVWHWAELGRTEILHADGTLTIVTHGGRSHDGPRWRATPDGEFVWDASHMHGPGEKIVHAQWRLSSDGNMLTFTDQYGRTRPFERRSPRDK